MGINRKEAAAFLSELLEKKISLNGDPRAYWAKEATFDYSSAKPKRVDFDNFSRRSEMTSELKNHSEACDLYRLIPEAALRETLVGQHELDFAFMGFEHVYKAVRDYVPKDFVICDMGCYMAAQSYLFQRHAGYIGVDNYDKAKFYEPDSDGFAYKAPPRFNGHMFTEHYSMSIEDFMESNYFKDLDPEKTYFVFSYVPGFNRPEVLEKVEHGVVAYCSEVWSKGVNAEAIGAAILEAEL